MRLRSFDDKLREGETEPFLRDGWGCIFRRGLALAITGKNWMRLRPAILGILGLFLVPPAYAAASDQLREVETEFRKVYQNQFFSRKNPDSATTIKFDSSGKLTSKSVPGSWSTSGLMRVGKVTLSSRGVEISGRRVLLALRAPDADTQPSAQMMHVQITPVSIDRRVQVVVELSSPPHSISELNAVLSHVFEEGQLSDRVAKYWNPKTNDRQAFRQQTPYGVVAELEGGRPVYLVHPDVMQAPKPIHTPDLCIRIVPGKNASRVKPRC